MEPPKNLKNFREPRNPILRRSICGSVRWKYARLWLGANSWGIPQPPDVLTISVYMYTLRIDRRFRHFPEVSPCARFDALTGAEHRQIQVPSACVCARRQREIRAARNMGSARVSRPRRSFDRRSPESPVNCLTRETCGQAWCGIQRPAYFIRCATLWQWRRPLVLLPP